MTDKSDINFIAIDFETATSKRASICEVGICVVRHGEIAETRFMLVTSGRQPLSVLEHKSTRYPTTGYRRCS